MNVRNAVVGWAALTTIAALVIGCEKKACRAGEQVACECPGGGAGAQRCNRVGTRFEDCDCSVPPATASPVTSSLARLEASEERVKSSLSQLDTRVLELQRSLAETASATAMAILPALPPDITVDGYVDAYCACKKDVKCLSEAAIKYQEALVKTPMTVEQAKRLAACASRP